MYKWKRMRRSVLVGVSVLLVSVLTGFTSGQTSQQDSDFSTIILELDDLPPGFELLSGNELSSLESALKGFEGTIPGTSAATLQNVSGFRLRTSDPRNVQIVIAGIIAPLSPEEQVLIDKAFSNPEMKSEFAQGFGGGEVGAPIDAGNIGQSRIALNMTTTSNSMRIDYIVARRGPVLIEVGYVYMEGNEPPTSAADLARLLDERAIAIVGEEVSFRTGGPLVPELTTYIPTPLDVSTSPDVVGTNLFLAALLMLPFAAAAEIFTRILGEHEEVLRQRVRVVDWVARMQTKLESVTGSRLRRGGLQDALKVLGVIFFYGLVFSLLDRTWNPFSIKGLILLGAMMIAYGVVGIADDLFQWRAIRRWGLRADLTVRPTNFLLAAFSTTASRLFTLIPGMMFGTPEALATDENQFDEPKRRSLLKISAMTLTAVGMIVWIPTALTGLLQRLDLAEGVKNGIGAVEAILLVVFAVALENLFVQMLGMPGTLGHALKQRSRWGWLIGLGAVGFLFYHTLINPRGELAQAIRAANVQVFFGIAVAFVVVAFGLQIFLGRREYALQTSGVRRQAGLPVESRHMESQAVLPGPDTLQESLRRTAVPPMPAAPVAVLDIEKTLVNVPVDDCKKCPVCGEMIKAEARLCRFCRATFAVAVKGYCLECHAIVDVNGEGKCVSCGKEPRDIHVESRLLKTLAVMPTRVKAAEPPKQKATSLEEDANVKQCLACGKTIKAEARICRFCRARFEVRERGYCLRDHAVVDVKDGKCVQCGEAAQDVHLESTIIETGIAVAKPVVVAPASEKQMPVSAQTMPTRSQAFRIATPDEQTDHMSLILNWCERNREQLIRVNVISMLGGREDIVTTAHGKIREIEEHPDDNGIFRIEFDSKLKARSEFDIVMLGYEISGVAEKGRQLIIQKGPNQRFELIADVEPPKVEPAPNMDWPEIPGYGFQSCFPCGGKGSNTCESCEGYGKVLVGEPARRCSVCRGNGYLIEKEIYLGPMCTSCRGTGWENALKFSEALAQFRIES